MWSGVKYAGGQGARVAAPYGKPAVFVVGGKEMPELESFLNFVERENGTQVGV